MLFRACLFGHQTRHIVDHFSRVDCLGGIAMRFAAEAFEKSVGEDAVPSAPTLILKRPLAGTGGEQFEERPISLPDRRHWFSGGAGHVRRIRRPPELTRVTGIGDQHYLGGAKAIT